MTRCANCQSDYKEQKKLGSLFDSPSLPITEGHLGIGTWQGIWLCEHRFGYSHTLEKIINILGYYPIAFIVCRPSMLFIVVFYARNFIQHDISLTVCSVFIGTEPGREKYWPP
jgi:hypothetical protein